MPSRREMLSIAATVIADAAWIYPILTLIGFIVYKGGTLLPLPLVAIVILLGVAAGLFVFAKVENAANHATVLALFGLFAVYGAVSAVAADVWFDPLWGPRLLGGGFSGNKSIGLVVASVAAGLLWYRGIRIALETQAQFRLMKTFRTGIFALAVVILLEQAFAADFAATAMLVPFFAVCLAGLAVVRLPSGGIWARAAGATVAAVIAAGLVLGLIGTAVGGHGLTLLAAGWNYLLAAIKWLLTVILTPILKVIFGWFSGFSLSGEPVPRPAARSYGDFWQQFSPDSVPPFVEFMAQMMKYPMLLLFVYLLYRLLRWAYRTHARNVLSQAPVDRESIRENADPAADLIGLAIGLLPEWLRRATLPARFRYPKDKPGITEVYILYFDLLKAAAVNGFIYAPSATTRERQADIEAAIPQAPVRRITDCFNAACYGGAATDGATIAQLRGALESATGR